VCFTISATLFASVVLNVLYCISSDLSCLQGGYDSDFLDDSALIKAFDNAINPIKVFSDHIRL